MVKKIIACMLCMALLCAQSNVVFGAWDGIGNKNADSERLDVVDMNKISYIFSSGAVPSAKYKGEARYSAAWTDMVGVKSLMFNKVPRNWTGFDTLVVPIYSQKATGSDFMLTIFCDGAAGKSVVYYGYRIPIDWEGWKTFEISISGDMTKTNMPDISKVNYLRMTVDGWNCVPTADAQLYFDTIYCKPNENAQETQASVKYSKEDMMAFNNAAENGISIVPFSRNVLNKKELTKINPEDNSARVITIEDKMYVPQSFFEKFFSKKAENVSGAVSEDGLVFVPVTQTANSLNIPCREFSNLCVLGENVDYEALEKNKGARTAGAYSVCRIDADSITDDAYDEVTAKWRRDIVGDENNDITQEIVAKAVSSANDKGKNAWELMKSKADNEDVLFSKVTTTADMTQQYVYIANMAKAYATYGAELYNNKKLKKDIVYALDWMNEHYYGQAEIDGTGWRNTSLYNWWDWASGVPKQLIDIVMILHDEVSQSQIEKWIKPVDYFVKVREQTTEDGQAGVTAALGSALLLHKEEQLLRYMTTFDDYVTITANEFKVNGLKDDGTYIEHDTHTYNAGYGVSVLASTGFGIYSAFATTSLELQTPSAVNIPFAIYECFAPIMYKGELMTAFNGRRSVNEKENCHNLISYMLDMVGLFGDYHDREIKEVVKRNITEENLSAVAGVLSVPQAVLLTNILNDDTISSGDEYKRTKVYYNGDQVVSQRNGYAVELSMMSERLAGYESINDLHKDGWYQSDGMLYVYTDKDKNQYTDVYWNNRNPYHIAGTTVDTQEREVKSIYYTDVYLSSQDFVGGVELDGDMATAAMSLESFHNETDSGIEDIGYGGAQPLHNSTLAAKKAYFFFDDEVVNLGADINANDGFEVKTIVENRRLTESELKDKSLAEIPIINLTSAGDDGNVISNVLDNDLSSRWALEGTDNCWFMAELAEETELGYAGISFFGTQNSQTLVFDLEISSDGKNWETVYSGESKGEWDTMETFSLEGKKAKYVRYNGKGRSKGGRWNSVTEFKLYPPQADGSMKTAFSEKDAIIYGSDDITIGGVLMEKQFSEKQINNPRYAHIEGVGGYYLAGTEKLFVKKTSGMNSFIEMWMSHGVSPKSESYAYAVLPTKTADETKAYCENPDIEILSNTARLQAVREKNINATGIVFWEKGSFNTVTTDSPLIMMLKENGAELTISVADPTKKLTNAKLTVKGSYELLSADKNAVVKTDGAEAAINVDFTDLSGKTLTIKLKRKA